MSEYIEVNNKEIPGLDWGWLAFNKKTGNLEIKTSYSQDIFTDDPTEDLVPLLVTDLWVNVYMNPMNKNRNGDSRA